MWKTQLQSLSVFLLQLPRISFILSSFFLSFSFLSTTHFISCSIFVLATFSPSVALVCLSPRFIFNLLYIIFNLHYTTILYYNLFYIIIYFILLCLIYYSIFLLIYSIAFFLLISTIAF